MKDKSLFLILLAALAILMISVSSSFSQDIDISNMDNAQLMTLLQVIMQKLGNDPEGGSRNVESDQLKIENEELKIGKADDRTFRIYENKKLILERMPEYYFIQPQIIDEGDDGTFDPGPSDPGKKKDDIDCGDICHDQCLYEYDTLSCEYECYAVCEHYGTP